MAQRSEQLCTTSQHYVVLKEEQLNRPRPVLAVSGQLVPGAECAFPPSFDLQ